MTPDEKLDHTPITFGKFKARFLTPSQIAEEDPKWLVWAYENVTNKPVCSKVLYNACKEAEYDGDSDAEPHF